MSLSDLTPGYRNRSQVPPIDSLASRMIYRWLGQCMDRWQAAPIPDKPEPTITTSKYSFSVFIYIRYRSILKRLNLTWLSHTPPDFSWLFVIRFSGIWTFGPIRCFFNWRNGLKRFSEYWVIPVNRVGEVIQAKDWKCQAFIIWLNRGNKK